MGDRNLGNRPLALFCRVRYVSLCSTDYLVGKLVGRQRGEVVSNLLGEAVVRNPVVAYSRVFSDSDVKTKLVRSLPGIGGKDKGVGSVGIDRHVPLLIPGTDVRRRS